MTESRSAVTEARPRDRRDRRGSGNVTNVTTNVNVTNINQARHRSHFHPRSRTHYRPRSSTSLWFSFSFTSGRHFGPRFHPYYFRSPYWRPYWSGYWWGPRWHYHHWHVYHCPTWVYSPWHTVYLRPLGRPVHYTTYHTTYITQPTRVVQAAPVVHRDPCPFAPRRAWEHLAEGDGHLALEAFACLAREHPEDGLMHIGYALASSLVGAEESAIAIVRHAVYVDVESLLYVPVDSRLDELVYHLLEQYAHYAADPARHGDALFMIAVLRTIVHDHAGAYFAVTEAIQHGAADDTTAMLRNMLADQLAQEMLQGR